MIRRFNASTARPLTTLVAIVGMMAAVMVPSSVYAQSSGNPEGKSRLELAKEKLQQLRSTERTDPRPVTTSSTPAPTPSPAPAPAAADGAPAAAPAPNPAPAAADGAGAGGSGSTSSTPSSSSNPGSNSGSAPSSSSSGGSPVTTGSDSVATTTGGGVIVAPPTVPAAPAPAPDPAPQSLFPSSNNQQPIVVTNDGPGALIAAPAPAPTGSGSSGAVAGSSNAPSSGGSSSSSSGPTSTGTSTTTTPPTTLAPATPPSSTPAPSSPSSPSSSSSDVTLVAGPGFTDATPTPTAIGVGQYADARAISRWDTVPGTLVSEPTAVGVVAFHVAGINRVEFSVNGGPWTAVRIPSLNPKTGVVEYWAWVNPTIAADGPVEVRAIAYPNTGLPRLLEPLSLVINGGGKFTRPALYLSPTGNDSTGDGSKQNPFLSLQKAVSKLGADADGATIYLAPGTHDFSAGLAPTARLTINTRNTYVTIQAAPGVRRDEVTVAAWPGGGLATSFLRLANISLGPVAVRGAYRPDQRLWFDNCESFGAGQDVGPGGPAGGFEYIYSTNSLVHDMCNGFGSKAAIIRNTTFSNIGSDTLQGVKMAINVTVRNVDRKTKLGFHPDVVQWHEPITENRILYGLTATENIVAMGVGSGANCTDIAIVNCNVDNRPHAGAVFAFAGPMNHLYVLNSTFFGSCLWRVDRGFLPHNVVLEDSNFNSSTKKIVTYGGTLAEPVVIRKFSIGFD